MRIIVCAWMIIDIWGGGGGRERTVWYVWMEWSFFFFFFAVISGFGYILLHSHSVPFWR